MKVRSSRKGRNEKVVRVFYTAALFLCIIGVGMLLPRAFAVVSGIVMTPVHGLSNWYQTSEQVVPSLLRDRNELVAEIDQLESALLSASGQDLTTRRLQDENTRLRRLLGAGEEERILATVIARPGDLPYDMLQIDQGSRDGVQSGTLVFLGSDQVIGLVTHVMSDYSFVTLFTAPGAELTGFIAGPEVVATVEGVGGGVARVRVPQGVPLTVGDLVYVPSVAAGLFGQIDHIENRPSQPEQYGYIALPTALRSIYEVAVAATPVESATVAAVESGKERIIAERLLVEAANTVSFESLLASSTPSTTPVVNPGSAATDTPDIAP